MFAEIRSVPRDRAVVGVIVQDGQAMMSRRSCDHEVHCRSAAVLAGRGLVMLDRGNPVSGVFGTDTSGYRSPNISVISSYSVRFLALYRNSVRCRREHPPRPVQPEPCPQSPPDANSRRLVQRAAR
jgi:hypothetical protein